MKQMNLRMLEEAADEFRRNALLWVKQKEMWKVLSAALRMWLDADTETQREYLGHEWDKELDERMRIVKAERAAVEDEQKAADPPSPASDAQRKQRRGA